MNSWIQKLMDNTSVAVSVSMLNDMLCELAQELGFEYFAFVYIHPSGVLGFSNYPTEWQERYLSKRYELVDPILPRAKQSMRLITWEIEKERCAAEKAIRNFCSEACDFGIRSGFSIPIWTGFGHMSLMTVSSPKAKLSFERDIDPVAATNAVALLHAKFETFEIEAEARNDVGLTAKQALMLRWAAEGKSMKDIATIENMSFHNVDFHLKNARKALNAGSLPQATAIATKLRLI